MAIKETKDIRCANRLKILHTIIDNKNISRADIAVVTKLNKATVSTIVKELLDMQLVEETTIGESSGGRKPIILTFNPKVGYTISIDFNISKMTIILTDLCSSILCEHHFPVYPHDVSLTLKILCEGIQNIIATLPTSPYGLVGISVAVRGVVDLEGMIRFIPSLNWHNINLKEILKAQFKVPVFIENDGNLSALAEHKERPHCNELLVITIDDTISSGIISNGSLIRGFLGFANSIGHHVIDVNYPDKCQCGKYGCWEQFASYTSFLKYINQFERVDTIDQFIQMLRVNNPNAKNYLNYFLKYLSIGISNMIFILNCEHIIINSAIFSEFPNLLLDVHESLLLPITQFQDLSISRLGKSAPLLGAASISIEAFFKSILDF